MTVPPACSPPPPKGGRGMRFSWALMKEYSSAPSRQMQKPSTCIPERCSPKNMTPARTSGMLCSCERTLKVTADVHWTMPNSATLMPITPKVSRATSPASCSGSRDAASRPPGSKTMDSSRQIGVVIHMTHETMRSLDCEGASRARSTSAPQWPKPLQPPQALQAPPSQPARAPVLPAGSSCTSCIRGGVAWPGVCTPAPEGAPSCAKTACRSTQRMASSTSESSASA
mmetsp:Transcript_26257/g.81584  ORF Transcript_26257/g.81584 Transcript_26257/m.81584 type:complete len:228 (-) Transcript_26257:1219-1902(-)